MTDGDESGGAPMLRLRVGRAPRPSMTLDDLRRAEEAAADLDDRGVMASAWECGTAREPFETGQKTGNDRFVRFVIIGTCFGARLFGFERLYS